MKGFWKKSVAFVFVTAILTAAAFSMPVVDRISGMFYSSPSVSSQASDVARQVYGGGQVTASDVANFEQQDGTTYVYPRGVNVSKFDRSVFNAERISNRTGREGLRVVLHLSQSIETQEIDELPQEILELEELGMIDIKNVIKSSDSVSLVLKPESSVQALRRINADRDVESGTPDVQINALNLDANTAVGATTAREDFNLNGTGETLAVLDTGLEASHLDFDGRIEERKDYSGDGKGDQEGHGTHVAGTVLGSGAAEGGYYPGMSQEASLMSLKVLGDDGSGSISDVMSALEYAADNNASVISLSLGAPSSQSLIDSYDDTVRNARSDGAVVVAAAGNAGTFESINYPSSDPNIIAVGATDYDENLASFSSKGPEPVYKTIKPEVTAPGHDITSASKDYPSTNYTRKGGTSMATPVVSGVIGLARERNPGWSVEQVENAVIASGDGNRLGDGNNVFQRGTGMINASKIVDPDLMISETRLNMGNLTAEAYHPEKITLTSTASSTVNYSLGSEIDKYDSSAGSVQDASNAEIRLNDSEIELSPGESKDVEIAFRSNNTYSMPHGGLVRVNGAESYGVIVGGFTNQSENLDADVSLNASQVPLSKSIEADATGSIHSDGLISSYKWSMGDGTSLTGDVVEHSYDEEGNYTVQLRAETSEGVYDIASSKIEAFNLGIPEASLSSNTSEVEASIDDVLLNASESTDDEGIQYYAWDVDGDGTFEENTTSDTLVQNYQDLGTKNVKLKVFDDSGNSDQDSVEIDVVDTVSPEANASSNATSVNIGEDIGLSGSLSTDNHGIKSFSWNISGVVKTGENVTANFSVPGQKNIELEVLDYSNNSDMDSLTVDVVDDTPPYASLNISPRVSEVNSAVSFNASESSDNVGIADYKWDINGSTFSGDQVNETFTAPANYSAVLEVEDSSGNVNSTSSGFEVVDTTDPVIEYSVNDTFPETGDTVKFNASNSTDNHQIKNFTWDMGDGTSYSGQVVEHNYSSNGNYSVVLELYDKSLNKVSDSVDIPVQDLGASFESPNSTASDRQQWINISFTRPVIGVNLSLNSEDIELNQLNSTYFYSQEQLEEGVNELDLNASNDRNHTASATRDTEVLIPPVIEFLKTAPKLSSGNQVNFSSNISENNFNSTDFSIDPPNSTEENPQINTTEYSEVVSWNSSYIPETNGVYNATLNVTDDFNLNDSITKSFEVAESVQFTTNFSSDTSINWTLKDKFQQKREEGVQDFNFSIPSDDQWRFELSDNNTSVNIQKANLTQDLNSTVEWISKASTPDISGYNELRTFAANPEINFSKASIEMDSDNPDKLYRCSNYSFSSEECNGNWNDISSQASFSSDSVSLEVNGFSAFTALEEEETEDDQDEGSDSGGGGSSGGGGASFGSFSDPDLEVVTTEDSIFIYNIFESGEAEIDSGLPIEKISFEASDPENATIEVDETDIDSSASMQSIFEVNKTVKADVKLDLNISEAWMNENNFSLKEISFYSRETGSWIDQNPDRTDSMVYASTGDGVYGLGAEKACYSEENVSAVVESCKVYENPCKVPENADRVDSCQAYQDESESRQDSEEQSRESESNTSDYIERARGIVSGGSDQVSKQLERITEVSVADRGSSFFIMTGLLFTAIFGVGAAIVWLLVRRKRKHAMVDDLMQLTEMLRKLQDQGVDVSLPASELQEANSAVMEGDYHKAVEKTENVKKFLKDQV